MAAPGGLLLCSEGGQESGAGEDATAISGMHSRCACHGHYDGQGPEPVLGQCPGSHRDDGNVRQRHDDRGSTAVPVRVVGQAIETLMSELDQPAVGDGLVDDPCCG